MRLSVSLSSILLLYRLLFRFLARLRTHLLDACAQPFRDRNPRASAALTSPYAPAVGASLAGLLLGIYPAKHLRVSIALFAIFRALEFSWNMSEDGGLVWGYKQGGKVKRERPWWFGSWMLQPLALGQLFHAVTFDRDCAPKVCYVRLCLLSHANACSHSGACCSTIRLRTSSRSHRVTPPTSCGPRSTRLSIASRRWRASTGRTSPPPPSNRPSNPTNII